MLGDGGDLIKCCRTGRNAENDKAQWDNPHVATQTLSGTEDDLLVKLTNGEFREFRVPESRKFIIDGKEVTIHELKPGGCCGGATNRDTAFGRVLARAE